MIEILGALTFSATGGLAALHPSTLSEPASVTFCELVQRSPDYDNKRVSLTAQVVTGPETFALLDETCPTDNLAAGMIWLDAKDDGRGKYYDGWSGDEFLQAVAAGDFNAKAASLDWKVPLPVRTVPKIEVEALDRVLASKAPVRATITGRFDFVGKGRLVQDHDGRIGFSGGFGHLSGFSRRIVIERIGIVRPARR